MENLIDLNKNTLAICNAFLSFLRKLPEAAAAVEYIDKLNEEDAAAEIEARLKHIYLNFIDTYRNGEDVSICKLVDEKVLTGYCPNDFISDYSKLHYPELINLAFDWRRDDYANPIKTMLKGLLG